MKMRQVVKCTSQCIVCSTVVVNLHLPDSITVLQPDSPSAGRYEDQLDDQEDEPPGKYVPQSISNAAGQIFDIDIVLNEVFKDNDSIYVEYSGGPLAFRARWEGRPKSPDFDWGENGEVKPPHDLWLTSLDLKQEGIDLLIYPDGVPENTSVDPQLQQIKKTLISYAPQLQAIFHYFECNGEKQPEQFGRMNLSQFKLLVNKAKVINNHFTPDRIDEIFMNVATTKNSLERKIDATGASTFNLIDFMLASLHVANQRYDTMRQVAIQEGAENQPPEVDLLEKIDQLITTNYIQNLCPIISKAIDKLYNAYTASSDLLLRKGRRLTEQTLDSCQLKRVKSATITVDVKFLSSHLQRWNILARDISFQELANILQFAKQTRGEVENFELLPEPLCVNYDEFERTLLGMSYSMYTMKKREESFEEFLGGVMDQVFRKAGVLVSQDDDTFA